MKANVNEWSKVNTVNTANEASKTSSANAVSKMSEASDVFSIYIKMSETTYYQRNRDIMLNRAKNYYENKKELCGNEQKINIDHYWKTKKI